MKTLSMKNIKRKLPSPPPPEVPLDENKKKSAELFFEEKHQAKIIEQQPLVVNPKLENVAEWLNRSFDRQKILNSNNNNKNLKESNIQMITLTEPKRKLSETNYRQNSDESEKYFGINDDILEINLSNSRLKLHQHPLDIKQCPSITLIDRIDKKYLKSDMNDKIIKPLAHDPSIRKIYLYKDPKDQSDSLGIKITAQQKLSDLKNDLAALVTAIIPEGLVQRFDVPIKVGDEIVEINGVSLRNKTDEQIQKIMNSSYDFNNGEIEIVVRKIEKSKSPRLPTRNSINGEDSTNKNYEQFDELQSVTSSVGTLDPARSSPSARSSITSSPVSSDIMTVGNQNSYNRLNKVELISKRKSSEDTRSQNYPPVVQQRKSRSGNNEMLSKNIIKVQESQKPQQDNYKAEHTAPLLKISAPPESDENIFYSTNSFSGVENQKYVLKNNDQQLQLDQSSLFLTTTNKASQRSGSTKSNNSIDREHINQPDSLSSIASTEDMRRSSASSQRTIAVNEDQSHKSFTSINTQSTEVFSLDNNEKNAETNEKEIKKGITKSSNTLTIMGQEGGNNKNMLTSTSLSSITSDRKLSNDSFSADIDSDNFSKYFPSSLESSPRHSRDGPVSSASNTEKSKTSNKSDNQKESKKTEKDDGKTKSKSRLSLRFGKRSSSVFAKNSKNDQNKISTVKDPSKPFGEIQVIVELAFV